MTQIIRKILSSLTTVYICLITQNSLDFVHIKLIIFGKEYLCLILQFCLPIAYQYLTRLYRSMCCLIKTTLDHRTKEIIILFVDMLL